MTCVTLTILVGGGRGLGRHRYAEKLQREGIKRVGGIFFLFLTREEVLQRPHPRDCFMGQGDDKRPKLVCRKQVFQSES